MVYNHEKINLLPGGWYVVYKNGAVLTEEELAWNLIPNKKDIIIMGLKRHNKYHEIKGKESYIPPGQTHLKELAISNKDNQEMVTKSTLVGWFIGYYDKTEKVILRVDAETGKSYWEKQPYINIPKDDNTKFNS